MTTSGLAVGSGSGNSLDSFGLTTSQMQAANGANFGGTDVDSRFGGCGKAYSFYSSSGPAHYPRLKRYTGISGGTSPAVNCSNHNYGGGLLGDQGQ